MGSERDSKSQFTSSYQHVVRLILFSVPPICHTLTNSASNSLPIVVLISMTKPPAVMHELGPMIGDGDLLLGTALYTSRSAIQTAYEVKYNGSRESQREFACICSLTPHCPLVPNRLVIS